jgi:glyoxylase-like metal-dependent hydrolase (beta-lactamase superfamily II)
MAKARLFAAAAAAAIIAVALPAAAQNGPPPSPPYRIEMLAPGVYAAVGMGSNAGFVVGDDAVAVIDTLYSPEVARQYLADIRKITDKPIRYVIDTHYHVDHTSGNATFKAAGATIIAHPNVAGWIHDENVHLFGDRITPAQREQVAALVGPDQTTARPMTLNLGHRELRVRPVEGHTGGDLAVEVPDAHVLFTGDMVWNKRAPNLIDGTVTKWGATVDGFEHLPGAQGMTFVPGHGDVAKLADVDAFHSDLTDLAAWTAEGRKAGLTGEALTQAVAPKMQAKYGWPFIENALRRSVPMMEAELAGTKRVPQARR